MRILFLSNVFPSSRQPLLGTFNAALVHALAKQHDVRVVAPVPWTQSLQLQPRRTVPSGIGLSAEQVDYWPYFYTPKVARHWYGAMMWSSLGHKLVRLIREWDADAVVSYWTHPDGEVALRAARQTGRPMVAMVGGSDVHVLAQQGRRRVAVLDVLNGADAVVPVSHDLADTLEGDGICAGKLHVVYRGVDTERFHPGDPQAARARLNLPENGFVAVGVGRLVPVKQWETMISACALLRERGGPIACYVLGSGPCQAALAALVERYGCADCFQFPGGVAQADLADWYRAADAVTLPSSSEGVPNVLLEAIACGARFAASNVGGIPEIADRRWDRLFPSGDAMALADAWTEMQSTDRAGLPARRFQPGTWADSAEQLASIVQKVGRHGPHAPVHEGLAVRL